jgi:drug/metabolite transporter superfamily protein YnfA
MGLLGDIWGYLRVNKKWWLLPMIIMLVLIGLLIILAQSSAISPFIYAMF